MTLPVSKLLKKGYLSICKRYNNVAKTQYVNELKQRQHNLKLDQSQTNNLSSHGNFVQNPAVLQQYDGDHEVKRLLDTATESMKILEIIEKNHSDLHNASIHNASIYGKAMQKCNVLRDWKSVHKIMNLLLSNTNIKPGLIEFHVFMNSMTRSNLSNSTEIIIECFQSMIKEYKLTPDIITFGILLKSFTKRCKYKEAEKCWSFMINKYKIKPNELLYTQIITIYSKAHKNEKAKQLFDEYMDKVKCNELEYHIPTINAYLNVFSECGDINGIQNVLDIIYNTNGLYLDELGIITVMKCCVSSRKYKKCIKIFEKWLKDRNDISEPMIHLQLHSISNLINSNKLSFEEKHKLYLKLEHIIYHELESYGFELSPIYGNKHLEGAILLYADYDPMEIVKVFESLLDKKLTGYQSFDFKLNKILIDLHGFQLVEAQFVMRYLFAFKLYDIMESYGSDEMIRIIVGKGKHSKGILNEKGRLREFIIQELSSWHPPINAKVCPINDGQLIIEKTELIPYQSNNCDFADWYKDYHHS